jgi:hypothetical protein
LLPREREATGRGVRHKPDTWPSIQTGRQLAIQNSGRFPHVCCAVNNCSRDNGSTCFSPRAHNPSGRASFEGDAWRQAAFLAVIQAETSSASLLASRNTLAEIIHPRRFAMRQASYASFTDERRIADFDPSGHQIKRIVLCENDGNPPRDAFANASGSLPADAM